MPLYRKLSDKASLASQLTAMRWSGTRVLTRGCSRTFWPTGTTAGRAFTRKPTATTATIVDFNKRNNNPTNIQRLPAEQHLGTAPAARRLRHCTGLTSSKSAARSAKAMRSARRMSERMQQPETRQILSEQAKAQWEDEAYKAYMAGKWREFYDSNENIAAERRCNWIEAQRQYWADGIQPSGAGRACHRLFRRAILKRVRHFRSWRKSSGRMRICGNGGAAKRASNGRRSSGPSAARRWIRPTTARAWLR